MLMFTYVPCHIYMHTCDVTADSKYFRLFSKKNVYSIYTNFALIDTD